MRTELDNKMRHDICEMLCRVPKDRQPGTGEEFERVMSFCGGEAGRYIFREGYAIGAIEMLKLFGWKYEYGELKKI